MNQSKKALRVELDPLLGHDADFVNTIKNGNPKQPQQESVQRQTDDMWSKV